MKIVSLQLFSRAIHLIMQLPFDYVFKSIVRLSLGEQNDSINFGQLCAIIARRSHSVHLFRRKFQIDAGLEYLVNQWKVVFVQEVKSSG